MGRPGILFCSVVVLLIVSVSASVAAASSAHDADRSIKEWPNWSGKVACNGGLPFNPLVTFARPTDAEEGIKPSEEALRESIARTAGYEDGTAEKMHGWRLLTETASAAEFANGHPAEGAMEILRVGRTADGWEAGSWSSGCLPVKIRDHQYAITWTLAPGQHLGPSTRTVKVNLGPGECAGGKSQDQRLEPPEFRRENGALLMALWIHPVTPGTYTCIGTIEPPVKIRLPHRLGRLKLLDGGVFPPEPPIEEAS